MLKEVDKLFQAPVIIKNPDELKKLVTRYEYAKELDNIPMPLADGVTVEELKHIQILSSEFFKCTDRGFIVIEDLSFIKEGDSRKILLVDEKTGERTEIYSYDQKNIKDIDIAADNADIFIQKKNGEISKLKFPYNKDKEIIVAKIDKDSLFLVAPLNEEVLIERKKDGSYFRHNLTTNKVTFLGTDGIDLQTTSFGLEDFNFNSNNLGANVIIRLDSDFFTFDENQKTIQIYVKDHLCISPKREVIGQGNSIIFIEPPLYGQHDPAERNKLYQYKNEKLTLISKGGKWEHWGVDIRNNNIYMSQNHIMYKITLPQKS